MAQARTFTSLREHRNYRLWFGAQVVSVSGTWVQNTAQAWLVVLLTHSSPTALGTLALCQFGPFLVLGLFGGVVSDRLDNRTAMFITQGTQLVLAGALALLSGLGIVTLGEVYVIAALNGTSMVLDTPSRQAFTIQMVGRRELPNAVALNATIFNTARVVGPAIGGLLIGTVGVTTCFVVNAFSFLAVLTALAAMRPGELYPLQRGIRPQLFRGVADGLRFAWRTPNVLLILTVMCFIATVGVNFNVLLPLLASRTLSAGPVTFGLLSASFGAGALIGALFTATRGRTSWRLLFIGAVLFSGAQVALGPLHDMRACCADLVLVGAGFTLYGSNSNTTLQLATPDALRGRVMSLYGYVFFGTAPLGGLLAGWLAAVGNTELAFVVCGGVSLVAAIAGIVWADRIGTMRLPRRARAALVEAPVRV